MKKKETPNPKIIGGKPPLAAHTLPATADGQAVFRMAGIHDLAVLVSAIGTFHGKSTPFL